MKIQVLWSDSTVRTLVLVNLAGIMERADESLLPGVYREIGISLHASPTALGSLTLLRSLTQALFFPLAAFLAINHDRASVIALGAFMWSIATLGVGISSTFFQVAISRALSGIGLAIVVPAIQSIVADSSNDSNRGMAFGWLQLTGTIGSILGGLCSILLADTSVLGVAGWRFSFLLVASISIFVGILIYSFAKDPSYTAGRIIRKQANASDFWDDCKKVMGVRTFQILVAQGIVGTFPWATLAFVPMWLELTGFTNTQTAVLLGAFSVASGFGGLFGGKMGDIVSGYLPNSGRIMLAQISTTSGLPLAAILMMFVPMKAKAMLVHVILFALLGFFTSWNAPATNNPIFAEIVPEKSRTSIYALDRAFESLLASFAPLLVGLLAERIFGYVQNSHKSNDVDKADAESLGRAVYTVYSIPLTMCALIYILLYFTYPKDRDHAHQRQQEQEELSSFDIDDKDDGDDGHDGDVSFAVLDSKFHLLDTVN